MENVSEMAQKPIIISTGGGGRGMTPVGALFGIVIIGGIAYAAKTFYDQYQKDKSEKSFDTPAGAIALELKLVFSDFPVSDEKYKRAMLKVTPEMKDEVYRIYKANTGRNLSDDIESHIGSGTQATTARQEVINSTTGSLIKITPSDEIKFTVGKGSLVRFKPGSTEAIPMYLKPEGVLPEGILTAKEKPYYTLQPKAYNFLVGDVKEVPLNGLKLNYSWTALWKPILRTRKVYAAVQILLPIKDSQGNKTTIGLWVDALSMIQGKGTNYLKGLGCECKESIGLIA